MLKKERNYEFKKELLKVHKKNRRDTRLTLTADEFEIPTGIHIVLPPEDNDVILTAARDFEDYLFTSMNVSSMIVSKKTEDVPSITLSICKDLEEVSSYMGYRITVTKTGITVEGFDDRGVAQGLYFLEDLMNIRRAPFLKIGVIKRKALFSPRISQSPFGMYEYPDEAFALMAHMGFDTITLGIKDLNVTKRGYLDFNLLCERARKYGIDVYIGLYVPHTAHPDDEGAEKFYDNLYGRLFRECPMIKGINLIGEATQFNSRDPNAGLAPHTKNFIDNIPTGKPSPGWWPCSDYAEWVSVIKKSVRKVRPDADIIFCTYNWGYAPEEARIKLIESLPADISLSVTWDMFQNFKVGNSTENVVDYSLCLVGPGDYFKSEAIAAKKRGIRLYSIANTSGRTWDFGVVPYEPVPYQWIKRYEAILKAHDEWNLCGIIENIHYGFYPSFVGDLEKWAFFSPTRPLEEVLRDLLIRDFGEENIETVDRAMRQWSEAITYYVATNEDQYGAFRIGPSYPFWSKTKNLPENGKIPSPEYAVSGNRIYHSEYIPDMSGRNSWPGVRIYDEINSIQKMVGLFLDGINTLESIENPNDNLLRLINLGKFIYRTCITAINKKRHFILLRELDIAKTPENADRIYNELKELLLAERKNAEDTIPIVQVDSRLGWEPSMEYTTDEKCLRWKIRQIDYELNSDYIAKSQYY